MPFYFRTWCYVIFEFVNTNKNILNKYRSKKLKIAIKWTCKYSKQKCNSRERATMKKRLKYSSRMHFIPSFTFNPLESWFQNLRGIKPTSAYIGTILSVNKTFVTSSCMLDNIPYRFSACISQRKTSGNSRLYKEIDKLSTNQKS